MQLRSELAATVLAQVLLVLVVVFAAIGLFVRMGPAIEGILLRNDTTLAAAEDVLIVLAGAGADAVEGEPRERLMAALQRARENVTEPGEDSVLANVDAHVAGALDGDSEDRRALLVGLQELIALNRAMDDPSRAARVSAVLILVGFVNIPIIKFSVEWWNTLHQPASVIRMGGSAIDAEFLWPLLTMAVGFTLLFFTLHIAAMRNEIWRRRVAAQRRLAARMANREG